MKSSILRISSIPLINRLKVTSFTVKAWGDSNYPMVLLIHGLLDNAGSFDTLIPLLPPSYYYVCIDLPGHGRSSHYPPDIPLHIENELIVIKMITNYFNREKYILIGHSYGGQLSLLYTQLYPERVAKLIMLDTLGYYPVTTSYLKNHCVIKVQGFFDIEQKSKSGKPPTYTYEEAFAKLRNVRGYPISKATTENILSRMLIPVGNEKYRFSFDQRFKLNFNQLFGREYALEIVKNCPLQCATLIILAKGNDGPRANVGEILRYFQVQKTIEIEYVDGYHSAHSDNAESVASHITRFFRNAQFNKL